MNGILKHIGVLLRLRLILTAIAVVMAWLPVTGEEHRFMSLTTGEGLSDLVVNKIYKDSQGYVWLGTGQGLDRFDGVRIKSVPIPGENLNHKRVKALTDAQGDLYMGNADGLFLLDRSSMKLERIKTDKIKGEVNALAAIDGMVYIGAQSGLYMLDRRSGKLKQYLLASDAMSSGNNVTAMTVAPDSTLWLSTADALHRFDPLRGTFDTYEEAEQLYSITNIVMKGDTLYAGTYGNGIGVFDIRSRRIVSTLTAGNCIITSLAVDALGRLLAATDGEGVLVYSTDSGRIVEHLRYDNSAHGALRSNSVYSLYVDDLGLLWIGYYQDGADYTPNRKEIFEVYNYPGFIDTRDHAVRALAIKGPRKAIGTREGLYYIDEATGRKAQFTTPQIRSNIIFSIKEIGPLYYIGTYNGGMYVFDPATLLLSDFAGGKAPFVNGSVFCIEEAPNGEMWVGTSKGLFRFRAGKEVAHYTHTNSQLPAGNVYEIFFDSTGRGWVCAEKGIAVWNGQELRADGFPQGFANHEKVRDIMEDREGMLYFVPDRGDVFRANLELTKFDSLEGVWPVGNRAMTFLIEDREGMLWMGSEAGLARYDKKQSMSYFSGSNGLPSKGFTFCQPVIDENGDLWMGNTRGLVKLDFGKFKELPALRRLPLITDLESNGRSVMERVKAGRQAFGITLADGESNIAVSYANPDYIDPADFVVEYYLEGFEEGWNLNSGKGQIRYFNLPAGNYRLHLRQGGDPTSETILDLRVRGGLDSMMAMLIALVVALGGIAVYFYIKHRRNQQLIAAHAAKEREELLLARQALEAEKQKRYQTTRLSDEECKRIFKRLESVMKNDRPWTNTDLKSGDLAKMAGTSPHALSFLFNQWLNKSYYDYVNEYRVDAFKRLVAEGGAGKYTLTAMSQMCGFSSRASFFRHFKAATGVTPAEWVDRLAEGK